MDENRTTRALAGLILAALLSPALLPGILLRDLRRLRRHRCLLQRLVTDGQHWSFFFGPTDGSSASPGSPSRNASWMLWSKERNHFCHDFATSSCWRRCIIVASVVGPFQT